MVNFLIDLFIWASKDEDWRWGHLFLEDVKKLKEKEKQEKEKEKQLSDNDLIVILR